MATAARLLAPSGKKVIAFTGVPRKGYDGPAPRNRIIDEGPTLPQLRLSIQTSSMFWFTTKVVHPSLISIATSFFWIGLNSAFAVAAGRTALTTPSRRAI